MKSREQPPSTTMAEPPPPPRKMPLSAAGGLTKFVLLFGGISALVGAVLFVVFTLVGGPVWDDWILDERAVEAEAEAVGVRGTASTRRRWQRIHMVRVRFVDGEGMSHEAEAPTTDPVIIERARTQDRVAIEYDPRAPARRVRLAGETASRFAEGNYVPVGFFVVGLALVTVGYVGVRRSRAIYRDGEAVQAKVVSVTRTAARINKKRVMRVAYAFSGPWGVEHGVWRTVAAPTVGATIWVIYDPARPERNIAAA
jgi:hypothetical protein